MKKFFYQRRCVGKIISASEIAMDLLDQPQQSIEIKNGHSTLAIPSQTVVDIKRLNSQRQLQIRQKLIDALRHASRITLTPEK